MNLFLKLNPRILAKVGQVSNNSNRTLDLLFRFVGKSWVFETL